MGLGSSFPTVVNLIEHPYKFDEEEEEKKRREEEEGKENPSLILPSPPVRCREIVVLGDRQRALERPGPGDSEPELSCARQLAQHGQLHERARNVLKNPMRLPWQGQLSSWCPHPLTTFFNTRANPGWPREPDAPDPSSCAKGLKFKKKRRARTHGRCDSC